MEDIDSGAIEILKEAVNVISPDWMRAQLSDIIQNPEGDPETLFKHMVKYVSESRNLDETICLQFAYGFVKNAGQFLSLYSVEANRIMKKLSSKRKEIETQEQ